MSWRQLDFYNLGAINALFIIPSFILKKNRDYIEIVAKGKIFPSLREMFLILCTFFITMLAWVFFRSENLDHALKNYLLGIVSPTVFTRPSFFPLYLFRFIFFFFIIEWLGRENNFAIEKFPIMMNSHKVFILHIINFKRHLFLWIGATIHLFSILN